MKVPNGKKWILIGLAIALVLAVGVVVFVGAVFFFLFGRQKTRPSSPLSNAIRTTVGKEVCEYRRSSVGELYDLPSETCVWVKDIDIGLILPSGSDQYDLEPLSETVVLVAVAEWPGFPEVAHLHDCGNWSLICDVWGLLLHDRYGKPMIVIDKLSFRQDWHEAVYGR